MHRQTSYLIVVSTQPQFIDLTLTLNHILTSLVQPVSEKYIQVNMSAIFPLCKHKASLTVGYSVMM